MKTSKKGIDFIKNEEGERLKAYKCPAGVWTIGVGHTGKDVFEGLIISNSRSRALLKMDLERFENAIKRHINVELKQNEFDALVSFAFNVGVYAFSKSTLLKKINSNSGFEEIKKEFRKWIYANHKILKILVARREREIKLFKGKK